MIRIFNPVKIIDGLDQENNERVTRSSPIRLIDGGIARFAKPARIHQVAIRGNMVWRLRARIIVRL